MRCRENANQLPGADTAVTIGKGQPFAYTVTYHSPVATGGTTAVSNHLYSMQGALTANGFERSYRVDIKYNMSTPDTFVMVPQQFAGWSLSDNNTPVYADGSQVLNLTNIENGNVAASFVERFRYWAAEPKVLGRDVKCH